MSAQWILRSASVSAQSNQCILGALWKAKDLRSFQADTDNSDQIVEMYHIDHMYWDRQAQVNCVDPDEMPQNATSHQGLHCLPLIQQVLDTTLGSKLYLFKTLWTRMVRSWSVRILRYIWSSYDGMNRQTVKSLDTRDEISKMPRCDGKQCRPGAIWSGSALFTQACPQVQIRRGIHIICFLFLNQTICCGTH